MRWTTKGVCTVAFTCTIAWSGLCGGCQPPSAGAAETGPTEPIGSDTLTLIDERGESITFDGADLAELPPRKVEVRHEEARKVYEGVSLTDVLEHFGVKLGDQLRGRRTPTVVLCEATDDYRVAFALAEVDPATTDKLVLLAFRCDGQPLSKEEGPYRFIVPDEKRRVRSIRMLRTIRVINLADMPLTQQFDSPPAPPAK